MASTVCLACGKPAESPLSWRCSCGGPLETKVDVPYSTPTRRGTIFERFGHLYPYLEPGQLVSLGESETPLVESEGVEFKLEYLLPTGSFKDRGSCALISGLKGELAKAGLHAVNEDSSGNAGASIAAYSARAGLKCRVFVPAAVSGPKANQIQMYGAELLRVSGSRGNVTKAAQWPTGGSVYIGHVWHPYFRDGIRTLAYELYEQTGGRLPERVYLPVSAGTLLLGFISGLQHLKASGAVANLPKVVACQTVAVSPLFAGLKGTVYRPPESPETIADALVSTAPPLLGHMVEKVKEIAGETDSATEAEVLEAWKELSRKGFYVEPSSAVPFACMKHDAAASKSGSVVVLTGSGLKSREETIRRAT